jgi:glycosyltransferase involved in cell wall biosynthesis
MVRLLRKLSSIPAVVGSVRSEELTKPGWKCWLNRRMAGWADVTIAVSEDALEFAVRHEGLQREKAVVVMNGIDMARYDASLRVSAHEIDPRIPPGARVVGTVGRLGPEKQHRLLLEAFADTSRRVSNTHLVIAGDGPMRDDLAATARRLGLAESVHFLGFREDVPRVLAAMDVFCLPSLFEGISNALLEAMAMARPCVATAVAGNKALIRDGVEGLLVLPSEAKALADALMTLLEDRPRAAALGAAARKRVEQEFTVERMLDGYAEAYRSVLEKRLEGESIPRIFRERPKDTMR